MTYMCIFVCVRDIQRDKDVPAHLKCSRQSSQWWCKAVLRFIQLASIEVQLCNELGVQAVSTPVNPLTYFPS